MYFLRNENVEVDDRDPFDTTFAQNILPGKAELRLIEKEILKNTPEVSKLEDRVPGKPMLYLFHLFIAPAPDNTYECQNLVTNFTGCYCQFTVMHHKTF